MTMMRFVIFARDRASCRDDTHVYQHAAKMHCVYWTSKHYSLYGCNDILRLRIFRFHRTFRSRVLAFAFLDKPQYPSVRDLWHKYVEDECLIYAFRFVRATRQPYEKPTKNKCFLNTIFCSFLIRD